MEPEHSSDSPSHPSLSTVLVDTPPVQESEVPSVVFDAISRFRNFVEFHDYQPEDIWEQQKQISFHDFLDTCYSKLGFKFSPAEMGAVRKLSTEGSISRQSLHSCGFWVPKPTAQSRMITAISTSTLQTYSRHHRSKLSDGPLVSRTQHEDPPKLAPQRRSEADVFKPKRMVRPASSKTRMIKESKVEALKCDLERNTLDRKWDLIVKAGELNKWAMDEGSE